MIWEAKKARERFTLAHAPLSKPQTELQNFLEKQLESPKEIRSYGTASNPSQQLKNKLGQANTIQGGMLTLSVESKKVHDRAVATFVDDWAKNAGWSKVVACVAIIHPTDDGWRIGTVVEWSLSKFPDLVKERLFPDVRIVRAKGSPAESGTSTNAATSSASSARPGPSQLVLVHEFEHDDRFDDPNDTGHREAEFRKGWKDSVNEERAPYKTETLRRLTWRNLGYRLGQIFGDTHDQMIGLLYDWAVRQQLSTTT